METGIAGGIARAFINSKLTILLMVGLVVLGILSAMMTPREEEPQIDVPIANIFVGFPGASPAEIEQKVVAPLERIIMNIKGVEYVYSNSLNGMAMFIVRYEVGLNVEQSMVKLYEQLLKNMDKLPQGTTPPLVKIRGIDDVPMLSLTLFSETYSDAQLRAAANELMTEIGQIPDVADIRILGGRAREVSVVLQPDKMTANGVDVLQLSMAIQAMNQQMQSGNVVSGNRELAVITGNYLTSAEEIGKLVVGVNKNQPVYLSQVADISDRAEEASQYVSFGYGKASGKTGGMNPAVTIAIAKRQGTDAMRLSEKILAKVDLLKGTLLPREVTVEITRNYGATAAEKVSELILHLFWAVASVTILVSLSMGWRGGLVVFLSVPITFALTLFAYYILDYTLNRITLFALVFVTGIIVDDSIIVAENMHRHFKLKKLPPLQAAIAAISEVGNPTILATFTVIVAVLPMVFVSGLMGPYMSPMPIGASLAMIFSLFAALMFTPWLAYRLMGNEPHDEHEKPFVLEETWIYRMYEKLLLPMLNSPKLAWTFLGSITVLLLSSMLLIVFRVVPLKMLPFDNKNEFQVLVDMPEGSTLEQTNAVTREIAAFLKNNDEVMSLQTYAGTSSPITFNGLVRHYDLRQGGNVGDIQVVLTPKHDRKIQSHDIAKAIRQPVQEIGKRHGANVKIIEVPPGPPVMSTIVAEIYGPDAQKRLEIAAQVKAVLEKAEGVVDVDWQVEEDQPEMMLEVNREKAALHGIAPQQIVHTVSMALYGQPVSTISSETAREAVPVRLRLKAEDKSSIEDIQRLTVMGRNGYSVPVSDLVSVTDRIRPKSISRKNQQQVVYIFADVAGRLESPAYAMLDVDAELKKIKLPDGYELHQEFSAQPFTTSEYSLKWDGEWQITYEVFRDLGGAFAIALIGIYVLIVGWFQDFKAPVVMMISIPLSLVGILVGHWWAGSFFTATSMIGMIALAGIMVRNGVLLIDFVNLRLEDGVELKKALIEAGAVRTTPIVLTAGAVIVGAFVILFDPIFQGLAISLLGGSIASTMLTLLVVPLVFYITEKKKHAVKENEVVS